MAKTRNRMRGEQDSHFEARSGSECYFVIEAEGDRNFERALEKTLGIYSDLTEAKSLSVDTEIWLRFHLSDTANQSKKVRTRLRNRGVCSHVFLVGQPPASGSKISLEAYHIAPAERISKVRSGPALVVSHGAYQSFWIPTTPSAAGPSEAQTKDIFRRLLDVLEPNSLSLERDVIRTWLYVRDVDNNYKGMVDVRRELFERFGMRRDTHYIASTGIEGLGEEVKDLVVMDSLAVKGLDRSQITYMSATDYLSPTHAYNVTFERATRVLYGDRAHYYISGTASIDNEGNVLYPGNITRQANRTLVNVEALLNNYDAELSDLKILVVYLRDMADFKVVKSFLDERLPESIPRTIVKGSVCRPKWLIEMEGVAITAEDQPRYEPFC